MELLLNDQTRACGQCSLCCTLLPVKTMHKLGGQRCPHQGSLLAPHGPGCAVYRKPGFPGECALWSCRWLVDDSTAALARPDRSHYVIDIVPDFITCKAEDGAEAKVPVLQIWIDPAFPDAHRDPALRRWIVETEPNCAVLVRFNESNAIFLLPPHMSDTNDWEEVGGDQMRSTGGTHTGEEIAAVLNNSGAMR